MREVEGRRGIRGSRSWGTPLVVYVVPLAFFFMYVVYVAGATRVELRKIEANEGTRHDLCPSRGDAQVEEAGSEAAAAEHPPPTTTTTRRCEPRPFLPPLERRRHPVHHRTSPSAPSRRGRVRRAHAPLDRPFLPAARVHLQDGVLRWTSRWHAPPDLPLDRGHGVHHRLRPLRLLRRGVRPTHRQALPALRVVDLRLHRVRQRHVRHLLRHEAVRVPPRTGVLGEGPVFGPQVGRLLLREEVPGAQLERGNPGQGRSIPGPTGQSRVRVRASGDGMIKSQNADGVVVFGNRAVW